MWQPNGNQALAQRAWVSGAIYSESDFESTTVPIYALATDLRAQRFTGTTTGNDLKSKVHGIDGIYKYKGFFATGEGPLGGRAPRNGRRVRLQRRIHPVGHDAEPVPTWETAFRYGSAMST